MVSHEAAERPPPYRPSRGVAWARFLPLALGALSVALLAGAGMHLVFRCRLYVFGLVLVCASLPVWGAVHLAVRAGKCRWALPAAALGGIAAAVLYLGFYHVGMIDHWGWASAQRVDELPRYIALRQRALVIVERSLLPVARLPDLPDDHVFRNWSYFAAELLTAVTVLVFAGVSASRRPFCRRCGEWMISEMVALHSDDAKRIVQQLRDGDPVLSAPKITRVPAERNYAAVTVDCCPRQKDAACGGYVTVREVRDDRTWGARLLKRAGLSAADLRALAPRFPTLALVTAIAQQEAAQKTGPSSPEVDQGLSPEGTPADFWPVPRPYAGRVLRVRHVYLNALSCTSGLVAVLAGAAVALVGLAMLRRIGAPPRSGPDDLRLWLVTVGAALFVAGVVALAFWPQLLGGDLLPRIARREFKKRPSCLVDSCDPKAVTVDVLDHDKLARTCLENASDLGFLSADEEAQEIRFEGDRECWRVPGAAIISCELKELRLPPRSRYPTSCFCCVLRVRTFEGEREILLAPRQYAGLALLTIRRRSAAVALHERLLDLSRAARRPALSTRQKVEPELPPDALSVQFEPSAEDVAAALARAVQSLEPQSTRQSRWTYRLLALIGLCLIAVNVLSFVGARISLTRMLVYNGIILAVAALIVLGPRALGRLNSPEAIRRRLAALSDTQRAEILARRSVVLTPSAVRIETRDQTQEIDWKEVRKVERTPQRLFILTAPGSIIVVPRAAFGSDAAFERFADEVEAKASPAKAGRLQP